MLLKAAFFSALGVVAAGTGIALAGPVADAGLRAEALAAKGKPLEALGALDEAVEAIWSESPLLFRSVKLVDAEANGGAERTDRTFRPDETLRVLVQPVGYGRANAGSRAELSFAGDLAIENATGQVLAEATNLFTLVADSAPGDRHFEMSIGFVVPYVRPGDYIARFTVRDQNSGKSGGFEVPFTVAVPVAAVGASGTQTAQPEAPAN